MKEKYVFYGDGRDTVGLYREHKETHALEQYTGHGKWVAVNKIDAMGIDLIKAPEWLIKNAMEWWDSER